MLIPTSRHVTGLTVDGTSGAPPLGPGPISGGKVSAETDIQSAEPSNVAVSRRTTEDAYAFPRPLLMMTENIRLAQNPLKVMHL
jgi:hypothetical protein